MPPLSNPSNRIIWIYSYISIIFLFIAFSSYLHPARISDIDYFLAIAIIILGTFPFFGQMYIGKWDRLPLLHFNGFYYAVAFSACTLFKGFEWFDATPESIELSYELTLLGLASLYLGYYLSEPLLKVFYLKYLNNFKPDDNLTTIGITALLIYLFIQYIFGNSVPTITQIGNISYWFAISVILFQFCEKHLSPIQRYGLLFIIIIDIFLKLSTGLLYVVIAPAAFSTAIYLQIRKKVPLLIFVFSLPLVVILNMSKHEFRLNTWKADAPGSASFMRALSFIELSGENLLNIFSSKTADTKSEAVSSTINRIGSNSTCAIAIDLTPKKIPYWNGETYKGLITSWIPRFLWPEKPVEGVGQSWGHRYGFLDSTDTNTSYNLPWVIEFYINFGPSGVVLGMFLVGILYRLLVESLSSAMISGKRFCFGCAIVLPLWYTESNLSLSVGVLIPQIIYLYLLITSIDLFTGRNKKAMSSDLIR